MSDRPDEEVEQPVTVRVTDKRGAKEETASETEVAAPAPDGNEDLEAVRAEAAQHLDDLLRLKAEFENFRKRMVREQTQVIERAAAAVIERLLPVLDNFELALIAADRTKDYESLVKGVEMVYGELLGVLKNEGLKRIDALHQPFDPERHDAVMHAEGDGDAEVVVEEMRAGYVLGERVLRPAMVKVGSKAPDGGGAPAQDGKDEESE